MKTYIKKYTAAAAAVIMLSFSAAGCSAAENAGKVSEETGAETLTEQEPQADAEQNSGMEKNAGEERGREETVYVVAGADGSVKKTISSVWLKNPGGEDRIEDQCDLKDIINVKGQESYDDLGENEISWQAGGNDIWYRGESEKELPVTMSITYELDGREISADEAAGKSGHMVIRFKYRNNVFETKNINGSEAVIYEPFIVMTALALDSGRASDVTVNNGKVLNTGDRIIAVGYAVPGISESLGDKVSEKLSERTVNGKELSLPEEVVIEADVKDFSLLTTITLVDNNLFKELDLENIETIDDLKAAAGRLVNASDSLSEGSGRLYEGVKQLYEGADKLYAGVSEVHKGAAGVSDGADRLAEGAEGVSGGAEQLHNGAKKLNGGAKELYEGSRSLAEGADSVSAGADAIKDGVTEIYERTAGLPEGISLLYKGVAAVKTALKGTEGTSIYEGIDMLGKGAGQIAAGLKSGNAGDPGIYEASEGIMEGAGRINEGAERIAEGADALQAQIDSLEETGRTMLAEIQGASPELYMKILPIATECLAKANQARKVLTGIRNGAKDIEGAAKSNDASSPGIYEAADGIRKGSGQLYEGARNISDGANDLKNGIDTIVSDENLGAVLSGMETLMQGAGELHAGTEKLKDGSGQLSEGAEELANGTDVLSEGAGELSEGTGELEKGTEDLLHGARELSGGAGELSGGAAELSGGTEKLCEGSRALKDGAADLAEGAGQLHDGMAEFCAEGIGKLAEYMNGDVSDTIERLKEMGRFGKGYTTFSGREGQENSRVQFIIRTESIGE